MIVSAMRAALVLAFFAMLESCGYVLTGGLQ